MKIRKIPFSPPDISELEVNEVAEALKSGWITTGPRTKLLERRLAAISKRERSMWMLTAIRYVGITE